MKRNLLALFLSLGLTACNDDHKDQQNTIAESPELAPNLPVGTYIISTVTNEDLPQVGKYYLGQDGNKLLVLNDEQDRAQIVMSYDAKSKTWQSNQKDKNLVIKLDHYEKIVDEKLDINQLIGLYNLSFSNGTTIPIEVKANGQMIAKDPNCTFNGVITASQLANTAIYALTDNKCDLLKNNTQGYIVVDGDLDPTSFRMLSSKLESQDVWAFLN